MKSKYKVTKEGSDFGIIRLSPLAMIDIVIVNPEKIRIRYIHARATQDVVGVSLTRLATA